MRNVTNEFLDKLKVQVLDAASWLPLVEREEFYCELHEWAYGKYEETLLRQEVEKKQENENR
jgi:hypothetical protein